MTLPLCRGRPVEGVVRPAAGTQRGPPRGAPGGSCVASCVPLSGDRPAADNSAARAVASVYSVSVSLTSQVPTLKALHALNPLQQPGYSSPQDVAEVIGKLRTLPPLVFAAECDKLRAKMASGPRGGAFMLQGGDCAETFAEVTAANIQGKLRTLLSMAVVLTYAAQVPIVKVGR